MSLGVMKQALETLEDAVSAWRAEMEFRSCIDAAEPWAEAAEALRAAIEQAQEPVACNRCKEWEKVCDQHLRHIKKLKKLKEKNT